MSRGKGVEVGSTRVAQNGYHYTKTDNKGWRLTHHIVAEDHILGRELKPGERVIFKTNNKTDLRPENIEVIQQGKSSVRKRRAVVLARIADLQAELAELNKELENV